MPDALDERRSLRPPEVVVGVVASKEKDCDFLFVFFVEKFPKVSQGMKSTKASPMA
jgi:hypothetical protein